MNSAEKDKRDPPAHAARIEALIEAFPSDPGRAGKALRQARHEDPSGFANAVFHDMRHRVTDPGYHCALVLLRETSLLFPHIANPGRSSLEHALRITQAMQEVDGNFVNSMLTAAVRLPDIRDAESQGRILDLVSELPQSIKNWKAVARLLKHGDAGVRAKCAHLLANSYFKQRSAHARAGEAQTRERADLIEGLWEADREGAAVLADAALTDPNNRVAGNACLALYRMGSSRALSCLAEMIRRPESEFRVTAAWAMGRTRDPRFAPLLREAFASGDAALRRTALRSLGELNQTRIENATGGPRPLFVSRPASAGHLEVWARVTGQDGGFVDGILPIDFFVLGPGREILDFSVERPPVGEAAPSVRLIYPVKLREAFARGVNPGGGASAWALAGYGSSPDREGAAADLVFREDGPAIVSAFASSAEALETAAEACRAALGLNDGLNEQHLALFLDEGPHAGLDLSALEGQCSARSIPLHCWRIEGAAEESAESLVSEFAAALRDRYVIRTQIGETVRGFTVRDSGRNPPRFSRTAEAPAAEAWK